MSERDVVGIAGPGVGWEVLLTAKMACMQSDAMLPYVNGMLHLVTSIPSLTSGDKYPIIDIW
jgi:hypothetical protein